MRRPSLILFLVEDREHLLISHPFLCVRDQEAAPSSSLLGARIGRLASPSSNPRSQEKTRISIQLHDGNLHLVTLHARRSERAGASKAVAVRDLAPGDRQLGFCGAIPRLPEDRDQADVCCLLPLRRSSSSSSRRIHLLRHGRRSRSRFEIL